MSHDKAGPILAHLRLREEEESTVDVLSWPAGAGKTRAALQDVIRDVKAGRVVLWVTPTVEVLQEETRKRATGESRDDGFLQYLQPGQVEVFNTAAASRSGMTVGEALSGRLNDYLSAGYPEGKLFLASWPGYLNAFGRLLSSVTASSRLRLVVDEMPQVLKVDSLEAQGADVRWGDLLDLDDRHNLKLPAGVKEQAIWRAVRGGSSRDAISGTLRDLAEGLSNPAVWLSTLLQAGQERAHFIMYLRPQVLAVGGSVEILAANAHDSYLVKVLGRCGLRFRFNAKYREEAAGRLELCNGSRFTIVPLQEKLLSKTQYDKERSSHPDGLGGALLGRAAEAVRCHYGEAVDFIYCLPRAAEKPTAEPAGAEKTAAVLHGSNAYKDYLAAAYLAAVNWDSAFAGALRETWGLTSEELQAGHGAEAVYQYVMRIKGRHGKLVEGERYLVIVGDLETAEALQRKLPGSSIKLQHMAQAEKGSKRGKRGDGVLGSLAVEVGKADQNWLALLIKNFREEPDRELSSKQLLRLGQIAEALGQDREWFVGGILAVARGEVEGREVFPAGHFAGALCRA